MGNHPSVILMRQLSKEERKDQGLYWLACIQRLQGMHYLQLRRWVWRAAKPVLKDAVKKKLWGQVPVCSAHVCVACSLPRFLSVASMRCFCLIHPKQVTWRCPWACLWEGDSPFSLPVTHMAQHGLAALGPSFVVPAHMAPKRCVVPCTVGAAKELYLQTLEGPSKTWPRLPSGRHMKT
jgi:hypothetical protein